MTEFRCPYNNEKCTKEYLKNIDVEPCKEICPMNQKICYRWSLCFMAKKKTEKERGL